MFRRTTTKQSSGIGSRLNKETPAHRTISDRCTQADKVFRRTTTKRSSGIGSPLHKEMSRAQNNLGLMYENGLGVPKDYDEAVKWYRLAAAQGDALAQNNLGWMYDNG